MRIIIIPLISTGQLEKWNQIGEVKIHFRLHLLRSMLRYWSMGPSGAAIIGHQPFFKNVLISNLYPCWDSPSPGHHQDLALGHPGPLFWWCLMVHPWAGLETYWTYTHIDSPKHWKYRYIGKNIGFFKKTYLFLTLGEIDRFFVFTPKKSRYKVQ